MPTALIGEPLGQMPSSGRASSTHIQGIAARESTQKDLLTGNLTFELIEPSRCAEERWISDADSSEFCQLSLSEDAIPRKRMGIRHAERVPINV
jgi:hypothetical protein